MKKKVSYLQSLSLRFWDEVDFEIMVSLIDLSMFDNMDKSILSITIDRFFIDIGWNYPDEEDLVHKKLWLFFKQNEHHLKKKGVDKLLWVTLGISPSTTFRWEATPALQKLIDKYYIEVCINIRHKKIT